MERPGLYAVRQADGPHIHVNAETHKVAAEGAIIQPAGGHLEAVRLTNLKVVEKTAEVQFTQPIRLNKKFIRALHKIAFEMLCFQEGPGLVLQERFNPIREYVVWGRGSRTILIGKEAPAGEWERPTVTVHGFQFESGIQEWAVEMALGPLFFVDLSPDNGVVAGDDKELHATALVRLNDNVRSTN